jgi:hypothetical protein
VRNYSGPSRDATAETGLVEGQPPKPPSSQQTPMLNEVVVRIGLATTGADVSGCELVLTAEDCDLTQERFDQLVDENPELANMSSKIYCSTQPACRPA